MHPKHEKNTAFTLTELLVVVVLVGIVAAFGIPNYRKSVARGRERDATANLGIIREAARLSIAREKTPPPAAANVGAINTTLRLNIIEQAGNTYSCTVQNVYRCIGANADGWSLQFRLNVNDGEVSCNGGSCPTL